MLGETSEITVEKPKIESLAYGAWIGSASNFATFADWVISYFKEDIKLSEAQLLQSGADLTNIYVLTNDFAILLKKYQEEFVSNRQKNQKTPEVMLTEFIICGFSLDGIPKINRLTNFVFSRPPFTPEEIRGNYYLAGHPVVARHYILRIEKLLSVGKMDTSSLIRLAVFLINETSKANIDICLPIDVITLKHNAPAIEINQDEIKAIIEKMNNIVDVKKILSAITKNE